MLVEDSHYERHSDEALSLMKSDTFAYRRRDQQMVVVHFIENRTVVLTQLRNQVPPVDQDIKIKGRKGKVLSVKEIEENVIHVQVFFEPVIKKQLVFKDDKKRRR